MNRCGYYYQQRNLVSVSSDSVVCPKPRRIGNFMNTPSMNDQIRPSICRINRSHQTEISDSKAGTELLDIILDKGSYGVEKSNTQLASSPPFFAGSPPSRASNPLTQDSQFGNNEFNPFLPVTSPSSSVRTGGSCARASFGHKPTVRIEGFDCLNRDRRSISAVA